MSDDRRRELGSSDAPLEDEVAEGFDATVSAGAQRVNRRLRDVIITGLFGGLEVGTGVMAYLGVLHETGSHLLAGLAFSIGFIALMLAHSELFTENFLMPVAAVAAREGTIAQLLRLWVGTLARQPRRRLGRHVARRDRLPAVARHGARVRPPLHRGRLLGADRSSWRCSPAARSR